MDTIVYGFCLVVGLVFALASAIAGHLFGGDHDAVVGTGGEAEAGFGDAGIPTISFFSPTVLASFVTAFGAFGLIFSRIPATQSVWLSAPLAILCALGVAVATLWFFNTVFRKTQSSSESKLSTVVGMTATVITPIPENGVGEIAYVQGGTRYNAPARAEGGVAVPAGRAVRISRIVGTQFYVEPIEQTRNQA
ncbi:MAG: NfeD family protein [Verrucomicrobiae bacterium]|nr:NfeD family protein [Verrucomicrobiae bacterium]MDW7980622.1 NfeD family protein [Verrucomicrobiales bacterium]